MVDQASLIQPFSGYPKIMALFQGRHPFLPRVSLPRMTRRLSFSQSEPFSAKFSVMILDGQFLSTRVCYAIDGVIWVARCYLCSRIHEIHNFTTRTAFCLSTLRSSRRASGGMSGSGYSQPSSYLWEINIQIHPFNSSVQNNLDAGIRMVQSDWAIQPKVVILHSIIGTRIDHFNWAVKSELSVRFLIGGLNPTVTTSNHVFTSLHLHSSEQRSCNWISILIWLAGDQEKA